MQFTIEIEQEVDGRWIAEVLELPGVLVYGSTRDGAIRNVQALAIRVLQGTPDYNGATCSIDHRNMVH